ncbi:MAG: HlyD family efflux transporter periplasmic adaptor subunit [Bacteroidetes bacterium]|nr:MAG: HlyD family efflux transporter periplasmic adaptor subunit [Bacteroidota bacterium]
MLQISNKNAIDDSIYQSKLKTLKVLQASKASHIAVYWLSGILFFFIILLFFPWQQNINAEGKVTALKPEDRPQTVMSMIAGRIKQWKTAEGAYVKKGDTILILSEVKDKFLDPEFLQRLSEQKDAKQEGINATSQKINALDNQLSALQQGLILSIEKAKNKVKESEFMLISDSTDFEAEKLHFQISKRQLEGAKNLYDQGLVPLVKFEASRMKFQEGTAKLIAYENKFLASKNKVLNARIELQSLRAEYLDKISKSESEQSATRAYLADAQGSLSKLKNEYASMQIRNEQYCVLAPQDGYIVKSLKAGLGEMIKEGEAVVTIMPDKPSVAVELYVKAMDVPLLAIGRKVRLEFDGWPAIQFSGWQNMAVGTFGGTVEVIDYVNSKGGKYRILVSPDPNDVVWPMQIRQGSGARGWVMLNDVPIWYEIWRQLNGFPPSLEDLEESKEKPKEKEKDKESEE